MYDAYARFLWPELVRCYLGVIIFLTYKYHATFSKLRRVFNVHGGDQPVAKF